MHLFEISKSTMMIVLVAGHFFSGILVIAYTSKREKTRAFHVYLLSKFLQLCSWSLLDIKDQISGMGIIAFGNSLLFAGVTCELIAFLSLKDGMLKSTKNYIALTAGCIFAFCLATGLGVAENVRIAMASAFLALQMAYPVFRLLTDKQGTMLQRLIAACYGINVLMLILRAVISLTTNLNMHLGMDSTYSTLLFVFLYLDMIAGSTGFILMHKEKQDAELLKAASLDGLTHIFNRQTFEKRAEEMISMHARKQERLSFLVLDIDDFKNVNDTFGHQTGDLVLRHFADTIAGQLRNYDLFGRFGGEEFAILLPQTGVQDAQVTAERLRAAVEASPVYTRGKSSAVGQAIRFTVSIGVSTLIPSGQGDIETLYRLGDQAMYQAKARGKNRVEAA
ncbi:MAG: GGDEF domain-containing protein [Clostridiales bacterium]|nr:GGDEF domain-containing protein [Clostridiales bacterium]